MTNEEFKIAEKDTDELLKKYGVDAQGAGCRYYQKLLKLGVTAAVAETHAVAFKTGYAEAVADLRENIGSQSEMEC